MAPFFISLKSLKPLRTLSPLISSSPYDYNFMTMVRSRCLVVAVPVVNRTSRWAMGFVQCHIFVIL